MANHIDKEEKEIVESFERDEWVSTKSLKKDKGRFKKYAEATLKKNKRINIRISDRDLYEIQRKAVHEGLPYQTLISSILHKFINGSLAEKNA